MVKVQPECMTVRTRSFVINSSLVIHASLCFSAPSCQVLCIISSRAKGFFTEPRFGSDEIGMSLTSPLWGSETVRRKTFHPKANLHNPSGPRALTGGALGVTNLWNSCRVPPVPPSWMALEGGSMASPRLLAEPGPSHTGWEVSGWKTLKRSGDERCCGLLLRVHTDRSRRFSRLPRACRDLWLPGYLWCEGCAKSQNRLFCLENIPMWQYQHKEMNNTVILYLEG